MGRQAELEGAPLVLQQLERELERIAIFVTETAWDEQVCAMPQTSIAALHEQRVATVVVPRS